MIASQYRHIDGQSLGHLFIINVPLNGGVVNRGNDNLELEVLRTLNVQNDSRLSVLTFGDVCVQDAGCIVLADRKVRVFVG